MKDPYVGLLHIPVSFPAELIEDDDPAHWEDLLNTVHDATDYALMDLFHQFVEVHHG